MSLLNAGNWTTNRKGQESVNLVKRFIKIVSPFVADEFHYQTAANAERMFYTLKEGSAKMKDAFLASNAGEHNQANVTAAFNFL